MSLLCGFCESYMEDGYKILGFLGHPSVLIMDPNETPVSIVICNKHFNLKDTTTNRSELGDQLIFSLVNGGSDEGNNLNGAFSLDQDDSLKKQGNFDSPRFLGGDALGRSLPRAIDSLRESASKFPPKLQEALILVSQRSQQ